MWYMITRKGMMFKKILQLMKLSSGSNDDKEKRVINAEGLGLGVRLVIIIYYGVGKSGYLSVC